ncbi:hypothetical protein HLH14_14150 [Acinetobacter sp. ANC 4282]|uniref:hypothetical protein n=1 Tax=Acinetobacter terrae TaxID=2731247 RepID=UPI0014908819|nr:hypothetical protein [Acinetobacter terrae]NNH17076.1 hypothetical protein [Acinetobacter terrae]
MSMFFPSFEQANIFFIPYDYKPLSLLVHAISEIRKTAGEEYQVIDITKKCMLIVNKYISVREIYNDDINNIREVVKRGLSRSDLRENAKIIYKCFKYVNPLVIIGEVLENLILNNIFNKYGLLVERNQWDYIFSILKDRDLIDFIQPIFKDEIKEKYFNIPIITFLPISWISELIILPPAKNLFFIHPEFIYNQTYSSLVFKAPDNSSIEAEIDNIKFIKKPSTEIDGGYEFNLKFSSNEEDNSKFYEGLKSNFENVELFNNERILCSIDIKDKDGNTHWIECNKQYLTIDYKGVIGFSVFENSNQIHNVKYLIKEIDTINLTSENLNRAKKSIMEKWKKPLRDYPNLEILISKLEKLGAMKATMQNIKNWCSPDNIAPRSFEDYKAVLLFAGITDKEEIDRFFELAKKLRGDSISEGHEKRVVGQEIVIDFLKKIKSIDNLGSNYEVDGISFSIITLG